MTIEEELAMCKAMVKLYRFDYLTGMKQRRDFEHETRHKFNSQEFYLTMYDITGLHAINRSKGYDAGDTLVRQVANDIQHQNDVWEVYRIGGDEFMLISFTPPTKDIANTTSATVQSKEYLTFSSMVTSVDKIVTAKKAKLHRRRSD